jgi:hypothetical protein
VGVAPPWLAADTAAKERSTLLMSRVPARTAKSGQRQRMHLHQTSFLQAVPVVTIYHHPVPQ